MKQINEETDNLMGRAVKDLEKAPEFLSDVKQSILKCLKIEEEAFQQLSSKNTEYIN